MNSAIFDKDQIKAHIAESRWFAELPEAAIDKLAASARAKSYQSGEFIYMIGDELNQLFSVINGKVRISLISVEGQKFLLTDLEAGQWFGEGALIKHRLQVQEARVEGDSVLLQIPTRVVLAIAEEYPMIFKNLLFSHFYRIHAVYELLAGMVFYPLKSRLAGRIINLAAKHGRQTADGVKLEVKMSQLEFAQMTMGSRQRVNKVLRGWVQRGILEKQKDYYVILDMDALEDEIDGG